MNESQVYDFCLDWQMNRVSKKLLCKQFIIFGWVFQDFKNLTERRSWFINSMYALLYAEDFSQ
jgi:hypothetical protein